MEHSSFTQQELTAFNQLVRVLVRDLLPFIKRIFTSLFSETVVEQLALSTPYALRHNKKSPSTSSLSSTTSASSSSVAFEGGALVRTGRPVVNLGMELNMDAIAEPLRQVAATVFQEMETMKQQDFALAVNELHQSSGGGGESGEGGDGGEVERSAMKTVQKDNEIDDGGIVMKSDQVGREKEKEKEEETLITTSLKAREPAVTPGNEHGRQNIGSPLIDTGSSLPHKSIESHKSVHSTNASTGSPQPFIAGSIPPQKRLLLSDLERSGMGAGEMRTMNQTLHNTTLAKDKAA